MPATFHSSLARSLAAHARTSLWALAVVLWLAPLMASAQNSASDKAMAEMLFDRGLSLMRQGQYAEACDELERSQAVDSAIGTMLYLAECYEKLGRTASAWALFREASSAARNEGQTERAKQGSSRADRLEPQLSKLTINVPSPVPGLQLLRNGQPVSSSVYGTAVPMDPGEQRFEARAAGYAPWIVSVTLPANGASLSVDVPALTPLPASQQPPPMAAASSTAPEDLPGTPTTRELVAPSEPRHASVQGPVGLVLGGVGIVGIGVGSFFGARAISKNNSADAVCPNRQCPADSQGKQLDDQARNAATLSNVFVIGGAVLLVGGAVLYFTRPKEHSVDVALRSDGRSASVVVGGNL
jgi:serine/threonine-protein kinase